ncbi:YhgE/Pip domain-containing protein [Paenibacillus piri]|uniref:YhgE/Pip domain-containing protein n=1 Tax=Paenibacillus piri TaxID=2547395 RepID=A0A4R5KNR4_9BACL|nr:YhgE/Pip domain-containing protein [Paenibacillus piri]TDF96240.1 YhgE/Pip domain-containing protein [Paenibacillus piri]
MNGLTMAIHDIKAMWSSNMVRRSVLGSMILPLMYSFIYLWAFWNPTDLLHHLPLAVVNLDQGTVQAGKQVNLGQELTDKLLADEKTHWTSVTAEEGRKGVRRLTYFLVLTIPADFSERAYSPSGPEPKSGELVYTLNEGANMLGAKVVRSVMDNVGGELSHKLREQYLRVMFDQVLNGGVGLKQAAEGAGKLAAGTNQAAEGVAALTAGLKQTQEGMAPLAEGLSKLLVGANQLENGLIRLDTTISLASGGVDQLADRLGQINGRLDTLLTETGKLQKSIQASSQALQQNIGALTAVSSSIADAGKQLDQLKRDYDETVGARLKQHKAALDSLTADLLELGDTVAGLSGNERFQRAVKSLQQANATRLQLEHDQQQAAASLERVRASVRQASEQLQQGNAKLGESLSVLTAQVDQLHGTLQQGLEQLRQNAGFTQAAAKQLGQLSSGVKQLEQGSTALLEGINTFSSGFQQLRDGNTRLLDGSTQLEKGLKDIQAGQQELAAKLSETAGMAAMDGKADERIQVIDKPILLTENNLYPVPNNGTGFAPYFIALSLWVGSLVLFFVIDLNKVVAIPKRPISYLTNKYLALSSVSVFQAIVSVFVLHTGLGIPTVRPAIQMYGFALLIGLVFTAILFMLLSLLGNDVGRFAAIVILMLQLTSSSGSYPVEMENGFFRFIHPALPMTYAVEGFRHLISIGDAAVIGRNALILFAYGLGALILLYVVKRHKLLDDLQQAELTEGKGASS